MPGTTLITLLALGNIYDIMSHEVLKIEFRSELLNPSYF